MESTRFTERPWREGYGDNVPYQRRNFGGGYSGNSYNNSNGAYGSRFGGGGGYQGGGYNRGGYGGGGYNRFGGNGYRPNNGYGGGYQSGFNRPSYQSNRY